MDVFGLWKRKKPARICTEDPDYAETRRKILEFNRKFNLYLLVAVFYGLFFINYIDILTAAGPDYHLWLAAMYFFPFVLFSLLYPRNWALSVGLGLIASLMNDVFYGSVKYLIGLPIDLSSYYHLWLIPGGTILFNADLGFTQFPIYSWMMALSIYLRVVLVVLLLRGWKSQAKIRCLEDKGKNKSFGQLLKDTFGYYTLKLKY